MGSSRVIGNNDTLGARSLGRKEAHGLLRPSLPAHFPAVKSFRKELWFELPARRGFVNRH